MTRMEKWKEKRERIKMMNKYLTRYEQLEIAFMKDEYEPKYAKGSRQRKDNA